MKLIKNILGKIVGIIIILVAVCAFFGGCDSSSSSSTSTTTVAAKETEKETETTTEAVVESAEEETTEAIVEAETEAVVVETVAATEPLPTFDDPRDEGIEQTAMDTHGISMQTIRKLVAKYRYDDEYTATLSNYECLFYLEDSIEEYNYKITEDGYMAVEWETPEAIDYLRYCISNPDNENTILTVDEAAALSDDDVIGIYGLMYTWEIYNQDDPGEGGEGDPGNTYDVDYDNYKEVARYAMEGDIWNIKYLQIFQSYGDDSRMVCVIIPGDGRSGHVIYCYNDSGTRLLTDDVITCQATVGFDQWTNEMEFHITSFSLIQ